MTNTKVIFTKFHKKLETWIVVTELILIYIASQMSLYPTLTFSVRYFVKEWNLPLRSYGMIYMLSATQILSPIIMARFVDSTSMYRDGLILSIVLFSSSFVMMDLLKASGKKTFIDYFIICVIYGISQFWVGSIVPLLDCLVVSKVAKTSLGDKGFGRVRLASPIGQTLAVYIIGFLCNKSKGESEFRPLFIVHAIATTMLVILSLLTFDKYLAPRDKSGPNTRKDTKNTGKSPIMTLMNNKRFVFFLISSFLTSIPRSVGTIYLQSHQMKPTSFNKNEAITTTSSKDDYSKSYIPRITAMFSEILISYYGKEALTYIGPYILLGIGQFSGVVRCILYGVVPMNSDKSIFYSILIESLKGISGGATVISSLYLVFIMTTNDSYATGQILFSTVYNGIGQLVTGVLGGIIGDYLGTYWLFGIAGIVGSLSMIQTLLTVILLGDRKCENEIKKSDDILSTEDVELPNVCDGYQTADSDSSDNISN